MTNEQLLQAIQERSIKYQVDFNFLLSAVNCFRSNINSTTDEIIRAYFQMEVLQYPGPEQIGNKRTAKATVKVLDSNKTLLPGITKCIEPGGKVRGKHVYAYTKVYTTVVGLLLKNREIISFDLAENIRSMCIDLVMPVNYDLPGAN